MKKITLAGHKKSILLALCGSYFLVFLFEMALSLSAGEAPSVANSLTMYLMGLLGPFIVLFAFFTNDAFRLFWLPMLGYIILFFPGGYLLKKTKERYEFIFIFFFLVIWIILGWGTLAIADGGLPSYLVWG